MKNIINDNNYKDMVVDNTINGGTNIARKLRTWYPGAIYHLRERGVRGLEIFQDDFDKMIFMEILRHELNKKG